MGLCGDGLRGCLFHLINVILLVCGVVLAGVGIWMAVAVPPFVGDDVKTDMWLAAVSTMTSVGFAIILVGVVGCCGVKRSSPGCLNLYVILIIVIIAAELTMGIVAIVFRHEVDEQLEESMLGQVVEVYGTDQSTNDEWDQLQKDLKCCGAISYLDYRNSNYHNATNNIIPDSCCNTEDSAELVTCRADASGENTDGDFLYTKGCYIATKDVVKLHSAIIIGLGFGFAGVQALNILLACGLKRKYRKRPTQSKKGKK